MWIEKFSKGEIKFTWKGLMAWTHNILKLQRLVSTLCCLLCYPHISWPCLVNNRPKQPILPHTSSYILPSVFLPAPHTLDSVDHHFFALCFSEFRHFYILRCILWGMPLKRRGCRGNNEWRDKCKYGGCWHAGPWSKVRGFSVSQSGTSPAALSHLYGRFMDTSGLCDIHSSS